MSGWSELCPCETLRGVTTARVIRTSVARRGCVVLLHGFAGSSADWTRAATTLALEGVDVLGIDLPGHGGTPAPAGGGKWSLSGCLDDLAEVAGAFGMTRPHWVGYSMGGRAALRLALHRPDVVSSLTLESTSPGIDKAADRAERRGEDEALALTIESRGIEWFVGYWETVPLFESQRRLSAGDLEAQRARRLANRPAGLAASLRHMGQGAMDPCGDRLGELGHPTLLVAGELDPKYRACAAQMAMKIPGAQTRTIPDAGHNTHLEQPEAFERALLDHLDRVMAEGSTHASTPATRSFA